MFLMRLWYGFLDRMRDRRFKAIFISSGVSLVVLAAIIITVVVIAENSDYKEALSPSKEQSVSINGIDVTGMSEKEIEELFKTKVKEYELTVLIDGEKIGVIDGKSIDLKYNSECDLGKYLENDKDANDIKKNKKSTSKASDEENTTAEAKEDTTELKDSNNIIIADLWLYDEEKFDSQIENIVDCLEGNELTLDSVNLEYSEETGFYFTASEEGKYIDAAAMGKEIKLAVESCLDSVDLSEDIMYSSDISSVIEGDERLKKAVETLNLYNGSVLNYDFNGTVKVIDKENIHEWFYLDEDFNVNVDNDAVQVYANKLVEQFTDYSKTTPFLTSYGSYINLRTASSKQVDIDVLLSYLAEDIKSGTSVSRTIPYADLGPTPAESNFGGTYVEINLTKQHLFFYYQGNLIVDCDIVSGSVDKGYATPGGVFTLRYKKQNATLKGADYSTPVDYWMPFNGGIGMHDAAWRTEFGGSIYLMDGSHGCINMPHEAVAKVYEYAYAGMYVIVYGGSYSLGDEAAQEALNQSTTEASTEETAAATTKAAANNTTNTPAPVTTEEIIKPVTTEAVTEAPTEAQTETQPETVPSPTETSGENMTAESSE